MKLCPHYNKIKTHPLIQRLFTAFKPSRTTEGDTSFATNVSFPITVKEPNPVKLEAKLLKKTLKKGTTNI
jgi:hypothetical protein